MVFTRAAGLALLLGVLVVGACTAARQAPAYTDDAIRQVTRILGGTTDDAIRHLDDAAAAGKAVPLISDGVATWGGRVNGIADDLVQRWQATPSEDAAVRQFVVSSACDAFEAWDDSTTGVVSDAQLAGIVNKNRTLARLPGALGDAAFAIEVHKKIMEALKQGDVTSAFPGLARVVVCQKLSG
jgi:hypothetical protein